MAGKIALDLKEFKHVSSDDKTTKLRHKGGHFLVLSHKTLSPEAQKQLEALAKVSIETAEALASEAKPQKMAQGGAPQMDAEKTKAVVNYANPNQQQLPKEQKPAKEIAPSYDEEWPLPSTTSVGKAAAKESAKRLQNGMAEGGRVCMAEGEEVPSPQLSLEQLNQQLQNAPQTAPDVQFLAKSEGYEGILRPPIVPSPETVAAVPEWLAQPTFQQPQASQAEAPTAEEPQPQGLAPQPQAQQLAQSVPSPQDAESLMREGYQSKLAGINQAAQAEGELGKTQAEALNRDLEFRRQAEESYNQKYNELEAERQAHMQDIKNGHINPEKYWENHSRIAAGIGMILGGFGAANGGPNQALEYIKYQMNQNIEAQKANLGSHYNMLNANLQQFGNLRDAVNMTRIMQSDVIQDELMKGAAIAKSPQAKAAALQAAGQLKMEYAPLQQQMAMRGAMVKMAGSNADPQSVDHMLGYMRVMNPEMAKEMESRYVPGVGLASVPVPEKVRGEIVAHDKLQAVASDLLNYSKKHTNLVPGTAEYNVGVQKATILQQVIREGLLGTVYRDSEKPLLEKFVDDNPAGAFKALSTQPKLKTILESNAAQGNILKRSYGLKPQASPQSVQSPQNALTWAKSNPKDPRAQEILKRLGR